MFCCLLFINKHNNGTLSTTKEIVSPVFHDLWGYPIPWTNAEWNDQKRKDLVQSTLKTKVSPRHVPAKIISIHDIPRTRSGKITELAVRDIIHGKEIKNSEALSNPEALELYKNLTELKN